MMSEPLSSQLTFERNVLLLMKPGSAAEVSMMISLLEIQVLTS